MLLMAPLLEDLLMARNTDIHTSTLRVFDQYEQVLPRANIDFRISPGDSRVWGNDLEPCQGKTPHSTISLPRNLRKGKVTVRELSKPIGRLSFTAIAVLSAPSSTSTDLEIDLPQLFRGENGNFGGCEERTVMVERKFHSLLREIFNFSPPQIIISSDASLQGWGTTCHGLTTGGMEERKFHINA